MCICVVFALEYVCMCVWVFFRVWKPKIDVRDCPYFFFFFLLCSLRQSLLVKLRRCIDSQLAQGIKSHIHLSILESQVAAAIVTLYLNGFWGSGFGPFVCTANILATKSSFQA